MSRIFHAILYRMEEKKQSVWELVRFAIIAVLIVIPIRLFIAEPFVVSGSSMVPTFLDKDYLIVDKLSYKLNDPERYDVVIFKYPNDPKKYFIKRIIGLPNETIEIKNNTTIIHSDQGSVEITLTEPYANLLGNCSVATINIMKKLNNNEYFVMGDNRYCSSDSRFWGSLKKDFITGKAFLRLLPVKNMDVWPGHYKQAE